jgi:hypothetical protein
MLSLCVIGVINFDMSFQIEKTSSEPRKHNNTVKLRMQKAKAKTQLENIAQILHTNVTRANTRDM